MIDALLQARLGLVGLNLMLGDAAEATAMAGAIEFDSPYFGRDDGRAIAAVATGDLDTDGSGFTELGVFAKLSWLFRL